MCTGNIIHYSLFSNVIIQPSQNFIILLTFVSGPQPHLVKCFENIRHLLIWKQEIGPPAVIMFISAEGETLVLPKYDIYVIN